MLGAKAIISRSSLQRLGLRAFPVCYVSRNLSLCGWKKAFFSSPLHREGFPLADRLCWSGSRDGLGAKGALGFALPLGLELLKVRGEGREEGMRRAFGVGEFGRFAQFCP